MAWFNITTVEGVLQNKSAETMVISYAENPTIEDAIAIPSLGILETTAQTAKCSLLINKDKEPIYAITGNVRKSKAGGGGDPYVLPTASVDTKGGIKVGDGGHMVGEFFNVDKATQTTLGITTGSSSVDINENGQINIDRYQSEVATLLAGKQDKLINSTLYFYSIEGVNKLLPFDSSIVPAILETSTTPILFTSDAFIDPITVPAGVNITFFLDMKNSVKRNVIVTIVALKNGVEIDTVTSTIIVDSVNRSYSIFMPVASDIEFIAGDILSISIATDKIVDLTVGDPIQPTYFILSQSGGGSTKFKDGVLVADVNWGTVTTNVTNIATNTSAITTLQKIQTGTEIPTDLPSGSLYFRFTTLGV